MFSLLLVHQAKAFETSYADSMLSEAARLPAEQGLIFMLDNFYSVFNKNYEDGVEWAEMVRDYSISGNFRLYEGRSEMALGTIWYLRGDYEVCFEHFQNALSIFEELENNQYIGRVNNELSVYYRKQKLYQKGLECLDRSFEKCMEAEDYVCVETSVNNRGVIHEMMGEFDQALFYYRKAEGIAKDNENDIGLSYIYNNLAECHRLMEQYDSTEYYIQLSTEIRLKIEDIQGVAMNYANLGEMLTLSGDLQGAKRYLQKTVNLTREIKYLDLERHAYWLFFECYKKEGDMDSAMFYLDRSLHLKDSILTVEKVSSLSEMEVRFETEKVEREYAEEKQLRSEAELEVANRNNLLLIIGGGALSIVFLLLYLIQRRKKLAEIERNKAVLEEKQRGLEAVFDATEEERQRIAKDLHDGIGQQMSGLKLAWENLSIDLKDKASEEASKLQELGKILDGTAQEVRDISHQMMPKVLSEFGLIPALEEMLSKSLKLTNLKYEFEHFNISGRFHHKVELSLYRIAQELVNNVIKHSGASSLAVQLFKNKSTLILIVEDNGSGFEAGDSDGHGLLNIKSRLNTINGEVNYEASTESGTMATIRVDLNHFEE